jgi:hypothetical protein
MEEAEGGLRVVVVGDAVAAGWADRGDIAVAVVAA